MTEFEFDFLRSFLKARSGLALTSERYLVESRLGPVCRRFELDSLSDSSGAEERPRCRSRTGRHRSDDHERNLLLPGQGSVRSVPDVLLPRFIRNRASTRRLRIWCAAASSGQEPFRSPCCSARPQHVCRLAGGDPGHRHLDRSSRPRESRPLQPVRSAARPAGQLLLNTSRRSATNGRSRLRSAPWSISGT